MIFNPLLNLNFLATALPLEAVESVGVVRKQSFNIKTTLTQKISDGRKNIRTPCRNLTQPVKNAFVTKNIGFLPLKRLKIGSVPPLTFLGEIIVL